MRSHLTSYYDSRTIKRLERERKARLIARKAFTKEADPITEYLNYLREVSKEVERLYKHALHEGEEEEYFEHMRLFERDFFLSEMKKALTSLKSAYVMLSEKL